MPAQRVAREMGMKVSIILFSHLKQTFGSDSLELELSEGATSADLLRIIRARLSEDLVELPLQIAVNQVYVREAVRLHQADEIALIPPVQGG